MTRFQIVGIFEDKILTAGEFNGDGCFEGGHGEEVCRAFSHMTNEVEYRKFANDMNDMYFQYEEDVVYAMNPYRDIFDFESLDKDHKYFDIWFSDYLYIKNFTNENKEIVDETGTEITLLPGGWCTINFGNLYKQEDETLDVKCIGRATITVTNKAFIRVCQNLDWHVDDESEVLYIQKYTPAGEDFTIQLGKENPTEELLEYAESFDVDQHVRETLEMPGSPSSIRVLLEDAEWIDEELQNLAQNLK